MLLTPGLVSLNIHEALTFSGTEVVLNPEIFTRNALHNHEPTTTTSSTSFSSSVVQQQQHRSKAVAVGDANRIANILSSSSSATEDKMAGSAAMAVNVGSNPVQQQQQQQQSAHNKKLLLQAGDMIEIRVWDPMVHNKAENANAFKSNVSSIMRHRSSPTTSSSNVVMTIPNQTPLLTSQSSASSSLPNVQNGTNNNRDSDIDVMSGMASSVVSEASTGDDTEVAGHSASERASANAAMSEDVQDHTDTSTVGSGQQQQQQQYDDLTNATPRGSPNSKLDTPGQTPAHSPLLNTTDESIQLPPTKTVVAELPPPLFPTQPRMSASSEVAAATAGLSLPPKPPMRSRTTGGIVTPVVTDLFGSRTVTAAASTSNATSVAASRTLPSAASNVLRPRHFRDLSDMTVDTIVDFHIPNAATSEEDDDIWTLFGSSHNLRLSFVIKVTEKSLTNLKPTARTQVSLLRPIADLYGLSSFDIVTIHKIEKEDEELVLQNVSSDFVLVTIKDQFISRGDMHYFVSNLIGSWVYEGQRLVDESKGIQAHAKEIRHKDQHAYSGIITEQTKITFRSRSSRLIWLVQMSAEMWDYASPFDTTRGEESRCETYFDKWISFVTRLFVKWKEQEASHSLTVVFFSRTFIGTAPGLGARVTGADDKKFAEQRDIYGRRYEDHFRLVIENASGSDLDSLLVKIKEAFVMYPAEVGWNMLEGDASRTPSLASQGNVLEATNVTLNLFQFHYFDRDLNRTGNSLVIISAGNGVFEVDKELAGITYQRMMDNGIGSDMLSLALPPMHIAPFFLYTDLPTTADEDETSGTWEVPHWLHLSFISYDSDGVPNTSPALHGNSPRNIYQVQNIAGHSIAANGFLLPSNYATTNGSELDLLASPGVTANSFSLRGNQNASPQKLKGTLTQGRQLIAGREFRDILDACRPRHVGQLPSALQTLMSMYDVQAEKKGISPERSQADDNDSVIEEWGTLKSETDTSLDGSMHDLRRRRTVSLGQDPSSWDTSPRLGPMSKQVTGGEVDKVDAVSQASSFGSHQSLGVSYDRPFMAHAASPSLTGIQIQRSPSFEMKLNSGEVDEEECVSETSMNSTGLDFDRTDSPEDQGGGERNPTKVASLATTLRQLMLDHDNKVVSHTRSQGNIPLVAPTKDPAPYRQGSMHDLFVSKPAEADQGMLTSSTLSGRNTQTGGGIGAAISQYKGAPDIFQTDDSTPSVSRVASNTRLTSMAYARRQFDLGSRGMSPLLLPPVIANSEKPEITSHSYLKGGIESKLIAPLERQGVTAGSRSFQLMSLSRSPPASGSSPTMIMIENARRPIKETGESVSPNRVRASSRASRRRKAFNPFRQQDEDEVLAKKTHNRLRWTHVFPLGEIEFKRHAGPSYKSLSCPAILPLSVDYFPSQQEVDHNYTFSIYNVTISDFEHTPYSSNRDVLMEMVRQRLTQDYQLVPKDHPNVKKFRRETLRRADGEGVTSNVENPGTIRVFLSMGYSLQVLTYDPSVDVIEVTRYDAKNARISQKESSAFKYYYLCLCQTTKQFLPVVQTFTKYSALYNWNKVDRIICGDDDREMREGMRFKRIMFAVLPDRLNSPDSEDAYISKFLRLLDYFEKLRDKDESSEPLQVKIVRSNQVEDDDVALKKTVESVPGISWNAMQRFYVRLRKGKQDILEWMEVVVDSTFNTCWSYRVMFQWLVASSGKVEAQVQMLHRRCTQFGLKLVPFPQLSVSKDVYLNPFKSHVAFTLDRKEAADCLDIMLEKLDYVHDGVFFTDVEAVQECMRLKLDFGRRWSRTANGRQFVHRSGMLFVRILTETAGRAIVVVFSNYTYINKEEKNRPLAQQIFDVLAENLDALRKGLWTEKICNDKATIGSESTEQVSEASDSKNKTLLPTDLEWATSPATVCDITVPLVGSATAETLTELPIISEDVPIETLSMDTVETTSDSCDDQRRQDTLPPLLERIDE